MTNAEKQKKIRRIWVPQVAVDVETLRTRVKVARARGLDPPHECVADGVWDHLDKASAAAFRRDPLPWRVTNWWRGVLVETAYRHMHAAEAQIVELYDEHELRAEIPEAVARAQTALHREDLRQWTVEGLQGLDYPLMRAHLRRIMTDSFAALDGKHGQLRSFRNILLRAAFLISALVLATLVVVYRWPDVMPLCFPNQEIVSTDPLVTQENRFNCPTQSDTAGPSRGDALVVALLGLLGGALAAAVSIRNLKGTTTPYDVPVALAVLKVPLGAFTAILALVAIRAEFVPGLSSLDSQEQILAYALVFGFAQQVFTRLLDQRAQTLLENLPSKDAADAPPSPLSAPPPLARAAEAEHRPADTDAAVMRGASLWAGLRGR
jgi:hypothetical protein